jgi:outer membrane protein assembly factor BamD (BamD/ComL family)
MKKILKVLLLTTLLGFLFSAEVGAICPDQEAARVHYILARQYYRQGEFEQAKEEFEKVLRFMPGHQGAQWYLKSLKKEMAEKKPLPLLRRLKAKDRKKLKGALDSLEKPAVEKEKLQIEKEKLQIEKEKRRQERARRLRLKKEKAKLLKEKQELEADLEKYRKTLAKQKQNIELLEEEIEEKDQAPLPEKRRKACCIRESKVEEEKCRVCQAREKKHKAQGEAEERRRPEEELSPQQELEAKIKDYLDEGRYYYRRKNYPKAREEFNLALGLDARNKQARRYLEKIDRSIQRQQRRKVLAEKRKKEQEEKRKARLAEKKRKAEEQAVARAQEKLQKERAAEAEAKQRKTDQDKERKGKLNQHYLQGKRYQKEKDYHAARKEFKDILELHPCYQPAKDELKKIDAAIRRQEKEKKREKKIQAHYARGKKHLENKDFSAARKEFKDILILHPCNQYAKNALEKVEDAVAREKDKQKKIKAHYSQGKKHFQNKDYHAARKEFKDILILHPCNQYAKNALEKVEAAIAKEEKRLQGKINKYIGRGKLYFYQEKYAQALEEFGRALLLQPAHTQAERFIQLCQKKLTEGRARRKKTLIERKKAEAEALKRAREKLGERSPEEE